MLEALGSRGVAGHGGAGRLVEGLAARVEVEVGDGLLVLRGIRRLVCG